MAGTKRDALASTAYHEAGHAVIGRVLGLVCGTVTVVSDDDSEGHAITADVWTTNAAWEDRGKYRHVDSVYRARIMAYMAGALAEEECLGFCHGGDGDDRQQIDMMLDALLPLGWDTAGYAVKLRHHACRLVRRHRTTIQRVGAVLLDRGSLSASAVDQLLGGALPSNAP